MELSALGIAQPLSSNILQFMKALPACAKEKGISCTVVNARFVKPIDENMVRYLAKNHDLIVPMEENVASGGLSEKVITLVEQEKLPIEVLPITIPDEYVEHGNVDILKQEIGISTSAVLEKIEKELEAKINEAKKKREENKEENKDGEEDKPSE